MVTSLVHISMPSTSPGERPAAPAVPLIVNRKTVDPRDPGEHPGDPAQASDGRGDRLAPGARAIHVLCSQFAPVETTDDLLLVRSDAYELTSDGKMRPSLTAQGSSSHRTRTLTNWAPDFEQQFPAGAPSLRRCRRFKAEGDVTFSGRRSRGRCAGGRRVTSRTARYSADETGTADRIPIMKALAVRGEATLLSRRESPLGDERHTELVNLWADAAPWCPDHHPRRVGVNAANVRLLCSAGCSLSVTADVRAKDSLADVPDNRPLSDGSVGRP